MFHFPPKNFNTCPLEKMLPITQPLSSKSKFSDPLQQRVHAMLKQ